MINIELKISSKIINAEAMEKIRREIQHGTVQFIYDAVNAVAKRNEYRFNSGDVDISGEIKLS